MTDRRQAKAAYDAEYRQKNAARLRAYDRARYAAKRGDKPYRNAPLSERFAAHVAVAAADRCWEWTGSFFDEGYGKISGMRAHRVAWELANGPIPEGLVVCHACDNPSCVRLSHLFLGTLADNNADRHAKGRTVNRLAARNAAKTHCPAGHPYDETNTYRRPGSNGRLCRACLKASSRERSQRHKAKLRARRSDRIIPHRWAGESPH